ncbi:hypothetical protein A7982_13624 [Minicystis rosea]|nr:hypothetical protein A7982_13624 [Minicystis rosea]
MHGRGWDYLEVLSRWAIGLGSVFYVQTQHPTVAQTIAIFVGSVVAIALVHVGTDAFRVHNRTQ